MGSTNSRKWPVAADYAEALGGTLDYLSGMLAQAAGDTDRAIEHFREALGDQKINGTPVQVASVSHCLAESLLLRDGEGDRVEAVELLRQAAETRFEGRVPLAGRKASELLTSLEAQGAGPA